MVDPLGIRNKDCKLCSLHSGAINVCVSTEGPSLLKSHGKLPVLIVGEAPGRAEDLKNRPFVGASGKLLRSELLKTGLPLNKCYLTNTVKCYPRGTPDIRHISKCSGVYLKKEIELLSPNYILAVGRTALGAVVPGCRFSDVKGQILGSWLNDALVFPIWHPAYILRNRSKLKEWQEDLFKFTTLVAIDMGYGESFRK